ncbi:MAG: outer membrane beta-barrel protein [Bacteroidales bacterium]|nr:outer membrane beta-barrel protein [Bacteroidales bacterium]MDD3892174.1 outer membrane beta-barrel protein [Bacteroidales bacterium]
MKKLPLIAILLIALSVMAVGQNSKMWVGGSLRFSSTNDDGDKASGFSLAPQFGYVVNSNFTVGGAIGFSTSSTKADGVDGKDVSNTFSLRPFVRYSAIKFEKITIFAQGELPLNFHSGKFSNGTSKDGYNSVGINILPGLSYALSEKWGATLLMPSIFSFITYSNDYTNVNFRANSGYSIQEYFLNSSIGFIYKF